MAIRNLKDANLALQAIVKNVQKKGFMKQVGQVAADLVSERTTKGFGVSEPEGKQTRLKGLSPGYKRRRKRLKKQGQLADTATPTKSNLTKSGKMIKSIKSSAQDGQATVYLDGSEANRKAKAQEEEGRKFMNLSRTETKKIVKIIEDQIIRDIKKLGL